MQLQQACVLVAEDMEEMRNILRRMLLAMGVARVDIARHGQEAWELLQTLHCDLVLCDWNMPLLSGRELLTRVRADRHLHTLPFIMLTGENTLTQVQSAIAGGVSDFIVKPFAMSLLEKRMTAALAKAHNPGAGV